MLLYIYIFSHVWTIPCLPDFEPVPVNQAFLLFVFRVCLSYYLVCSLQPCGHLLERADLLALLYVMFSCVFLTFLNGVLGQVWHLIVSIPDLCFYFTLA